MDILLRFWLKNKKNLSKAVLGIFLLLTGAVAYYFLQEQNIPSPDPVNPQNWDPQEIVTPATQDFLTTYSAEVSPIHESDLAIVSVVSVWEVRTGQSAEELQRQALQLYQEAKREYDAGNLQSARRSLRSAISLQSDYQEAINLLNKVTREIEANQ